MGGICSAVVGRNGPFLGMRRRGGLFPCKTTPFSLHLFDITLSRLRTGESMHLVYFWPSPTSMARRKRQRGGICSAVVGRNGPFLYVVQKGWISMVMQNDHILATFDTTSSRLRTGESMHLVYFWPSPTSRARRERQRRKRQRGQLQCGGGS
jgi:hypothetical protein